MYVVSIWTCHIVEVHFALNKRFEHIIFVQNFSVCSLEAIDNQLRTIMFEHRAFKIKFFGNFLQKNPFENIRKNIVLPFETREVFLFLKKKDGHE
jgi:hypothetical protein